jgi:hypothetical protein
MNTTVNKGVCDPTCNGVDVDNDKPTKNPVAREV